MGKFERKARDNGENSPTVALTRAQQVTARRFIRLAHRYGRDFKRYLGPTRDIFREGEPITPTTDIRDALRPPPPTVQLDDLAGINLEVLNKWRERFHNQIAFDVIENERLASTYFRQDDSQAKDTPLTETSKVSTREEESCQDESPGNTQDPTLKGQIDTAQQKLEFWLKYLRNKSDDLKESEFNISNSPAYPRPETVDGADMNKLRQLRDLVAKSVHPEGRHIFFALVDEDARKLYLPKPYRAPVVVVNPSLIISDKKSAVRSVASRIERSISKIIEFMGLDQRPAGKGDPINLASLINGNNEYSMALVFARDFGVPIGISGISADAPREENLIYDVPFDIVADVDTPWYELRGYSRSDRVHYFNRLFAHFMGILPDTTPLRNNPLLITITNEQKGRRTIIPSPGKNIPFQIEWILDRTPTGEDVARRSLVYASNLPT